LNRREKEQVISDLHKRTEGYKAVVLTHYRGLHVEQINTLRQRLREEKISYHVVKNTLMKLAAKGTDLEKLSDHFDGPTAMAIAYGDPIQLAKILSDFVKTQPTLGIKAGLIEGRVSTPDEVKALAGMPSRDVLLAQVLGGIQMPPAQLAGILVNIPQQLLSLLNSRVEELEKAESSSI